MAIPSVLLVQTFKNITCFGRAFHMKGALAVMADEGFLGLASVLEHSGHFRLLYRGELGWRRQHEQWCGGG